MDIDPTITRRTLLAVSAAGAGAAALAACSSSSSPSSSSGGSTNASSQAGGGASGQALAKLADVPVGGAKAVKLPNGTPGIVARPTADKAACFSAICTHQGCTVAVNGKTLDCPCHGSQYNATTGAVLRGPAPAPLHPVAVTITGGEIVTA